MGTKWTARLRVDFEMEEGAFQRYIETGAIGKRASNAALPKSKSWRKDKRIKQKSRADFRPMNWRPRMPPGDAADNYDAYEIYDELCTPDGVVVATLACFAWNSDRLLLQRANARWQMDAFPRRPPRLCHNARLGRACRRVESRSRFEWSGRKAQMPAAVGGVPMTDDYRIYVEENWPATLNDGAGVPTDFATLQEAVLAWRSLAPEEKIRATIRVIGGPV